MAKTTKPAEEQPEEAAAAPGRQRAEVIRAGVLAALGRPSELLRVSVFPLWDNNFRVNVLTGEDAIGVLIPNSYFVTADERGTILRSEPPIKKQY